MPIFAPSGRPDFAVLVSVDSLLLVVEMGVGALLVVVEVDGDALLVAAKEADDVLVESGMSTKFHPFTCTPATPISSVATTDTVGCQAPDVESLIIV